MRKNRFCRILQIKTVLSRLGQWQLDRISTELFRWRRRHSCLWIRRFISCSKQG